MSAFSRLINLPASRRTYSSYFSSKAGGGRYFNSAKSPKVTVVTPNTNSTNTTNANAKNDSPAAADSQQKQQQDGVSQNATSSGSLGESQASPSASASSPTAPAEGANSPTNTASDFGASQLYVPPLSITAKDFKMHHFFSLHRPLLLLNEPASIFRAVAPNQPLFPPPPPAPTPDNNAYPFGLGLGEAPYDPYVDADAEAARQLTRALTMARGESALAWEKTLKHLGLDVSKDADRVGLQAQFEKDWEEVLLDSTKRKRRKKMKKHKLKKRRRATRSERLRLK